jgi:5-methylthioadenosine/S-adenosylhomocysteine deaminase
MQMGLGLPPTEAALAARAQINIGTDVVTSVSTDIFTQMRFLLQTQRALANDQFHKRETMPDKLAMTAKQALELVTIKSAECFGLGKRLGSLVPGKEADITLIRKSDINMRAAADPISAVVLHAGVVNVDTVIVGGKIVKQNGKLLFRDLPRKLEDLDRSSERLYAGFNAKATAA